MTDARTKAFINLYAILGTLPYLCEMDESSSEIIKDKNIAIGFSVKDGPEAVLGFNNGKCYFNAGKGKCDILLRIPSVDKFNNMIDGTFTPIPVRGLLKAGFLMNEFKKLTDILTSYLRPEKDALSNDKFFIISTKLMSHVIVSAIAQIGNEDPVGRASASYIIDGVIQVAIGKDGEDDRDINEIALGISADGHRLTAIHTKPVQYMSYMRFANIHLARALFDGQINAVACIGEGKVRVGGTISQVDNVNRILGRVALYLA